MSKPTRAQPEPTSFSRWHWGLMGALSFVVHATSLRGPFVFDDVVTVLENPSMHPPQTLWTILLYSPFRPLLNVSYVVDHALWGYWAPGFHLTNIAVHSLNTMLVFRFAWHWEHEGPRRSGLLAPLAATLFAVHPMLTEAVSYISGRSEVLCAFFFLAGLLAARRAVVFGRPLWLLATTALLFGAIACKEIGVMLPFVALAFAWLRFTDSVVRRRALRWLGPLAALMIAGALARIFIYLTLESNRSLWAVWPNLQLQLTIFWRYVWLFFVPYGQSLVHPAVEIQAAVDPLAGLAAAALALTGWLLYRARTTHAGFAFGVVWFVLLLLPSSSLIPLMEPMSEHRTYVASIGLFLAVAEPLSRVAERLRRRSVLLSVIALVCCLSGLTVARNRVWSDPIKLWGEAAEVAPRVWAAQFGLGDALREAGECDRAAEAYRKATELVPGEPRAYLNLGICLGQLGKLAQAYQAFLLALELRPNDPVVHANLGTLALVTGNRATARTYLQRAVELDPANTTRRERLAAAEGGSDTSAWPPK